MNNPQEFHHSFELSGVKFRGRYLAPDTSLDVFADLSPAMGDVLEKISPSDLEGSAVEAFATVFDNFKLVRSCAKYFEGAYEAQLGGSWLPVSTFKDELFRGKTPLYVAWLLAAVGREYSDFLRSSGFGTLKDLGKVFGFQITLRGNGQSGDSSKAATQP